MSAPGSACCRPGCSRRRRPSARALVCARETVTDEMIRARSKHRAIERLSRGDHATVTRATSRNTCWPARRHGTSTSAPAHRIQACTPPERVVRRPRMSSARALGAREQRRDTGHLVFHKGSEKQLFENLPSKRKRTVNLFLASLLWANSRARRLLASGTCPMNIRAARCSTGERGS